MATRPVPTRGGVFAALIMALSIVLGGTASAVDEEPKQVVEEITSRVIKVLADDGASTEDKRAAVQQIVYAWTDFETMSRLVLARNWSKLDESQQKEFVEQFRQHLSNTYGKNVDGYRDEKVTILSARDEARGDVTVKTSIVRGGPNDIFVDYRLRKTGGQWRIIDVVIERVSLVSNFRSQFQEIIAKGGAAGLLSSLRAKNAKGEGAKESPGT